jgi:hypothetical protein
MTTKVSSILPILDHSFCASWATIRQIWVGTKLFEACKDKSSSTLFTLELVKSWSLLSQTGTPVRNRTRRIITAFIQNILTLFYQFERLSRFYSCIVYYL